MVIRAVSCKWIFTSLSILAIVLFMVGCGGSSSGGGDEPEVEVETVSQVQLSGQITISSLPGVSSDGFNVSLLLIAVDENGNTSTAIVTSGNYQLLVSKNTLSSLTSFDLATMNFLGALTFDGNLGAFSLGTSTENVNLNLGNNGIQVAEESQILLPVTWAPQGIQEAYDPLGGIDAIQLQTDPEKVQHIALTDYLVPHPGTWTTDYFYREWEYTDEKGYERLREFILTYRDESKHIRRIHANFYDEYEDSYYEDGEWETFSGGGGFYNPNPDTECEGLHCDSILGLPTKGVYASFPMINERDGLIALDDDDLIFPIQLTAGEKFILEYEDSWLNQVFELTFTPNIVGSFRDKSQRRVNVLHLHCDAWSKTANTWWGSFDYYLLSHYGLFINISQSQGESDEWQNLVAEHIRFGTFDISMGIPFIDLTPTQINGVPVTGTIPGNPHIETGTSEQMRDHWLEHAWQNRDNVN